MRRVWFTLYHPHHLQYQVFTPTDKLPSSLFSISLSLSLCNKCSNPFTIFMIHHLPPSSMSTLLLYWGAQAWTQDSRCCVSSAEQRGTIISLDPPAILCTKQPGMLLGLSCMSVLLSTVQLLVYQDSKTLSCRTAFQLINPLAVLMDGVTP